MKKNKRGVGIKAKIYFDEIDLQILEHLEDLEFEGRYGVGVFDIVNYLEINHKSLKPHLDKLFELGLICLQEQIATQLIKGQVQIVGVRIFTPRGLWKRYDEEIADTLTESQQKKRDNEIENYDTIIETLRKARDYFYNKEKKKILNLDLRSKKSKEYLQKK